MKLLIKSLLIFFISNLIFLSDSIGQCVVRGKITDKNGEVLIGATVYPKSNMSAGAVTDINGDYNVKLNESNTQIIVISFVGYKTIEDTIKCSKGGVIINNYILESSVASMKTVNVTAKGVKNNDLQMETIKKQSSATIDYISAETIKKTGDANVASAVARVTGVSTFSGGLITVRGIGDRYVKTAINGSRIPTLDPFTNNIKLDIFPSSLIDNIIISKTASPDLPGDWAGAYLSVETKDYPDSLSLFFETSFGYNAQTTFKDVLSSERSSTDWLGYDNGLRDINHADYIQYNNTIYQQGANQYPVFAALGLANYFNSLGVTSISANSSDPTYVYFKLGLVQLGLLGAAQINDYNAVTTAVSEYESLAYKGNAYNSINANAIAAEKKLFPNNWNTTTRIAPLNNSQTFTVGNQTILFGKQLGFLVGLKYSSSTQYDTNSITNKLYFTKGKVDSTSTQYSKYQKISKETNGWSGLIKLAYKFNKNNNVSFLFMPNLIGTNSVRDVESSTPTYGIVTPSILYSKYQYYESRKQLIYQLKTEHYIPGKKIKIGLDASYTNGKSNAPDSKNYLCNDLGEFLQDQDPIRYYRYLSDNILDSRIYAEMPIDKKPELVRKIKIGGSYLNDQFKNRLYSYELKNGYGLLNDINSSSFDAITEQSSSYNDGNSYHTVGLFYDTQDCSYPSDNYFGRSHLISEYAMLDYSIDNNLRISGGFRVEEVKIYTDCFLFDSLGLAPDDPRRVIAYTETSFSSIVNPGNLEKTSILPSVNIIYKFNTSGTTPFDIRLNFSQTVSRPSIRELSGAQFYDFELNDYVMGNPDLKISQGNNYDIRYETFFKSGDNLSVSIFYKTIKDLIQLAQLGEFYTWVNNTNGYSNLEGIEIEGKKNIYKWLEFRANLTLVNSKTVTTGGITEYPGGFLDMKGGVMPMFGQAPYIVNSMLTYSSKKTGITATLSYNLQGTKLVSITPILQPDIYELPRHLLDFKISKKFGKHLNASFKVIDILNSPIQRSYKYQDNTKYFKNLWDDITNKNKAEYDQLINSKYRYGTNYVFALSYKL